MQIGKANDQPNFKINKKQVFDLRNIRIYKKNNTAKHISEMLKEFETLN